jgi:hypothetical protein
MQPRNVYLAVVQAVRQIDTFDQHTLCNIEVGVDPDGLREGGHSG